jgi:hypothetical protein
MMRTSNGTIDSLRSLGLVTLLLLLPATACGGSIEGQVLDAQTGKPIQGAVVLGVWTKVAGLPGLHHHELVGVREVETDADGRFTLERPSSQYNREDGESVTVYKFGYVAWNNIFTFPASQRRTGRQVPAQILLERFPQGESHQRHMSFISNARRAGMYGYESNPKFERAVDQEMRMP